MFQSFSIKKTSQYEQTCLFSSFDLHLTCYLNPLYIKYNVYLAFYCLQLFMSDQKSYFICLNVFVCFIFRKESNLLSITFVGLTISKYIEEYFVSPTLLRVVRVFRVSRVLRLVKSAKGIRTLLFSLAVSLPALFNIGLLLFLVLFIYAVFGMNFFKRVITPYGGLDDVFNFQTFGQSIITLFQMCTSAGWDGVLKGLMNEKDCSQEEGNCGSYKVAVIYLVTYLIISFLVVVNMYIAVILENFSQATEDVQHGLTPEDFDMYYEKWEKYDPLATQYISLEQLSDFVDYLEDPLRLPKPNHFLLVKLDIPIFEGDRCYCRDILDALTKNFLGTGDSEALPPEAAGTREDKTKIEYKVISSTLMRQKEEYAARIIQKAFRNWRKTQGDSDLTKHPPPYDEVAIEIAPEVNDNDKTIGDNNEIVETIEMENLKNEDIIEDGQARNSSTVTNTNADSTNQTVVEVDLKPDSDVVA